ncbi:MAG: TetR/AcrR family transcriptional regulator [Steroidobacteraceae bacterium]
MKRTSRSTAGRRVRLANTDARGQLLDAAITLFAERGIANTTVAQIAATAGVTSAMIHYWFDTRERLLDALVEERLAPVFNYIWDQGDMQRDAPVMLIKGVMQRLFEVTGRAPWLPSLWLREVVNEGGLLREYVIRRIPVQRVEAFREALARGSRNGALNPEIEPSLVFISILALVMLPQATGKIWQHVNPTQILDRAVLERHVSALLMHGIRGRGTLSRIRRARSRRAS